MSICVALLISVDPVTIGLISRALQQLSISPDVCRDEAAANRLLNTRKFDAVIIDLQIGEQSEAILDHAHLSPSNRTAVTFAISGNDEKATAAFRKKVAFVFERPLSTQSIRSTLNPAFGLILRERRRYFRYPVAIPITIQRPNKADVHCKTVNISGGGMAVSTFVPFSPGDVVHVHFTLPGGEMSLLAESKICWLKSGHLGVHFVSLSQEHKSELQDWLSQRLEETLPEFVAKKFQADGTLPVTVLAKEK
jgi:CheY-like chemotaxis protein